MYIDYRATHLKDNVVAIALQEFLAPLITNYRIKQEYLDRLLGQLLYVGVNTYHDVEVTKTPAFIYIHLKTLGCDSRNLARRVPDGGIFIEEFKDRSLFITLPKVITHKQIGTYIYGQTMNGLPYEQVRMLVQFLFEIEPILPIQFNNISLESIYTCRADLISSRNSKFNRKHIPMIGDLLMMLYGYLEKYRGHRTVDDLTDLIWGRGIIRLPYNIDNFDSHKHYPAMLKYFINTYTYYSRTDPELYSRLHTKQRAMP